MTTWKKPLPVVEAETAPYWTAARDKKLLLQKCRDCDEYQYHYRGFCSNCWVGTIEDVESNGEGTVWSFTVIRRNRTPGFAEEVPYAVAMVELEGGIKFITNVINCNPDDVHIGMPVKLTWVAAADDINIPMFEPA
ncbi:MAG TPA: Zn-ribbon domain-containing OB-fold protein [Dehalococcoidia bacterium]|nr:Zn-ribbon domain-containing OB-fold protein [Dehalococcoidia bacterium]